MSDIEVTGTIIITYAVMLIFATGAIASRDWAKLAIVAAVSCAVTFVLWVGIVPDWSEVAGLAGADQTAKLMLLLLASVLVFAGSSFKYGFQAAVGVLCVSIVGDVVLMALFVPHATGWLANYPMPAFVLFWLGLVILPASYFFAYFRSRYMVFGGLVAYLVILTLWLCIGPKWDVWLYPAYQVVVEWL